MKVQVIIVFTLIFQICSSCHYSCTTCVSQLYSSCLTCNNHSLVDISCDPNVVPSIYWASVYPTGTCISTYSTDSPNPLGVLLFFLVIGGCAFFRSKESFYLLFTMQSFGLYNLVEIGWINPIGFVLEAQQYFMPFNLISKGFKTDNFILTASKNFRLDTFFGTTNLGQNIALIAVITIICLVILIIIAIVAIRKKKQNKQTKQNVIFEAVQSYSQSSKRGKIDNNNENQEQCCAKWKQFSQKYLIQIAKFVICVLFLLVQQTSLVLLVSLVYAIDIGVIIISVLYLHILVFVMSYAYYYRVQYFEQKNILYSSWARKIILPVLIVVPIINQYLFFLFGALFVILDLIFDIYNGLYSSFNRLCIYKCLQMLIVFVLIIFYIVEESTNNESSSKAASITCTFIMTLNFFMFFAVQIPIMIKNKYFTSQEKVEQLKQVKQEDTILDIKENNQKQQIKSNKYSVKQQQEQQQEQQNQKSDKNNNESIITDHNNKGQVKKQTQQQPTPAPQPARKKRRKQIIDKQLRMRYGI